jgi:N-acyl-D-aspartate/D-glutamate deacylase
MKKARNRGIDISCDVYPYNACSTTITSILPIWVLEGGVEKAIEQLKDIKLREKIKKDIINNTVKGENWIRDAGWNGIFIGECQSRKEYEGKSLENILKEKNRFNDLFDGFFDLLIEIEGNAVIVIFAMDEEDVKTVISNPLSAIGSDSWSVAPIAGGKPHPRTYGTFPRVLGKYVREDNLLTLESAIRKMTSLPANKIGLKDRGMLKEGYYADIVIFDSDKIIDKATYANPCQYPEGIKYVIVNGEIVVDNGKITGRRSGKILKKENV